MPFVCGDIALFWYGMVNIIDGQIQLVVMMVNAPTVLSTSIRQNTQHRQLMLLEVWQHLVVKHIGYSDGCFRCVELGKCHLAADINESLLVDAPTPLILTT